MCLVIKFDCYQHCRVLRANDKIIAEPIDSVVPFTEVRAFLHAQDSRDLYLSQDDVFWKRLYKAVIQNLLRLGKWLLDVKRPSSISSAFEKAPLLQVQKYGDGNRKKDENDKCGFQDGGYRGDVVCEA